ncbi:MAG: alpha-amylase family glycosyl hydrolase [Melioribacteraceae bacterium]|nr:alpha-amylase family glycosyl hydrolase [Melioribacteraceae bacterium]
MVKTNPEIFLQGNKEDLIRDPDTFFELDDKIFAHGKDPYFSSWKDTIQINYFSEEARNIMSEKLQTVSYLCDGLRCDMAMLINNSVFSKTWEELYSRQSSNAPKTEFWKNEIERIQKERNDFIFIAEAYWGKGYELQQFGFDYTYDKTLLDRLKSNNANEVKNHLLADTSFQKKSLRFLENHDEQRASKIFDESQHKAAAVITYTLYGMKLIYDGQLEGRQIKLPVQLGREPKENYNRNLELFYEKLLTITSNDIFCFGNWKLIDPVEAWEGNTTYSNILSWLWEYKEEQILIIVNYAGIASQCSISIDTNTEKDEIIFHDILNEEQYIRATKDINNTGLYIDLQPFGTHIFSVLIQKNQNVKVTPILNVS